MRGKERDVHNTRIEGLFREQELQEFSSNGSRRTTPDLHELERRPSEAGHAPSYFNEEVEKDLSSSASPTKQRLLVVANRLPVNPTRTGEDSWTLETSAGGLVTALRGIKNVEARWIGWAGVDVPDEVGKKALTRAVAEQGCIPVFLDQELVNLYYNGYCNNILWPLFHYLGLPQEDGLATTRSFQAQFDAYKQANQIFASVIYTHYEEGDIVWCHDYHLMFVPKYLKDYDSKMKVGWFLHTPFPSSEIHRTLPSRSELLKSVLAADLIGFHTYDYARHFVSACTRILGLEAGPKGVEYQGKMTRVATFPLGIDSKRFTEALQLQTVQAHISELQEKFAGRKVILGIDRLDMIKGIPQKVLAFEKFLEENPDCRDKVVLLQIAVPTRTDVLEYQRLTSQVHEIVGRINGRYGALTAVPIHHLDCQLDFHKLCALYAVTDVAIVTSLRDGMNLVSYEFVACQDSKKGVLILSEFAGAAQSLGAGALLVNPWNITEVASSIHYALNMSPEEREKRHRHNYMYVTTHTTEEWAETFVSELNYTVVEAQVRTRQVQPLLPTKTAVECYLQSNNRLVILGFNATLTQPMESPGRIGHDRIKEIELKLHQDMRNPLKILCSDPKTTVVVLSGSERRILDNNFEDFNMWLAAENGMFLRPTEGTWMTTMPEYLYLDWFDSVKHVFEYFTDRTPRSYIQYRETSLVWNYKHADAEFGRLQARDMLQHLWTGPISNAAVEIVQGSRSVEVRPIGVTKGAAINRILGEIVHSKRMVLPFDYVFCMGHFLVKDEDIYNFFEPELPADSVGPIRTNAANALKEFANRKSPGKFSDATSSSKASNAKMQTLVLKSVRKIPSNHCPTIGLLSPQDTVGLNEGSFLLDLKCENYFSCAVGRIPTNARYLLNSIEEVVSFLKELAEAANGSFHCCDDAD